MRNNLLSSIGTLTAIGLLVLLITPLQAQQLDSSIAIYFRSHNGLKRFLVDEATTELVHSQNETGYLLSHNGQNVAFMSDGQISVTELALWNPENILPDTLNALTFRWTLDDTRIIVKTGTQITDSGETSEDWETYAYDIRTNQLESWPWGECRQIGRHTETHRIAVICQTDDWMSSPEVPVIALEWGGSYRDFDEDEYEILIENLLVDSPSFEWSFVEDQEQFVYVRRLATSQYTIYRIHGGQPAERIIDVSDPQAYIAVSPDGNLIAYTVDCTYRRPRSCLQIVELDTSQIIWSGRDTFWVESPRDIEWFPDSNRIALSAYSYNLPNPSQSSIWIFDVATGISEEYSRETIGDVTIGSIAVVELSN